jgi:hypothetical protein
VYELEESDKELLALAFIFKLAMQKNSEIINEEESSDQSD